jgi:hypothetical protein
VLNSGSYWELKKLVHLRQMTRKLGRRSRQEQKMRVRWNQERMKQAHSKQELNSDNCWGQTIWALKKEYSNRGLN